MSGLKLFKFKWLTCNHNVSMSLYETIFIIYSANDQRGLDVLTGQAYDYEPKI